MVKVYIINGTGGSGKDTFVKFCSELTATAELTEVVNMSSVERVKRAAEVLGWDKQCKTEKDRKFLSDLKKLSTEYNDISFKDIMDKYNSLCESFAMTTVDWDLYSNEYTVYKNILFFVHIREPEEIQRVKDAIPGSKTILVTNNNVEDITSNESDRRVREYDYDITINNSGTLDELKYVAELFLIKEK